MDVGSLVVGVAFCGLYAFVSIRMDHLLAKHPGFLRGVLIFNLSVSAVVAAIGILNGQGLSQVPAIVIAMAITAYLYPTVGRLSREAAGNIPNKHNQSTQPPRTTGG